jgi:hypothetical protein
MNCQCPPSSSSSSNQGSASGGTSAQSSTGSSGSAAAGATSSDRDEGKARGQQADKKRGLDRADEVAGEKGKQGRDNAREKQGRD